MKDNIIIIISLLALYLMYRSKDKILSIGKNLVQGELSTQDSVAGKNCDDLASIVIPPDLPVWDRAFSDSIGLSAREYEELVFKCTGVGRFQEQQDRTAQRAFDLDTKRIVVANFNYLQSLPLSSPEKQRLGYVSGQNQSIGTIIATYIEAAKMAYQQGWNGSKKGESLERVLLDNFQITINYNSFT